MGESKVFMFSDSDPEMQGAYEKARATFRYFWRELAWERRRIVPALQLACVKAPFSDGEEPKPEMDHPQTEQMWLDDVDFDGQFVSGVLLNEPNWLTTVKAGDQARIPLGQISDWMYVTGGEVYGAFTVNLMRSHMGKAELREHDAAWGLKFGDPTVLRIAPAEKGWFGRKQAIPEEHPMSEAMAPGLREQLNENPAMLTDLDDRGWTLLHHQSLAGSTATVRVLLEYGADVTAVTTNGMTALQLARCLGWQNVVDLLVKHGAKS